MSTSKSKTILWIISSRICLLLSCFTLSAMSKFNLLQCKFDKCQWWQTNALCCSWKNKFFYNFRFHFHYFHMFLKFLKFRSFFPSFFYYDFFVFCSISKFVHNYVFQLLSKFFFIKKIIKYTQIASFQSRENVITIVFKNQFS